jgi:very-short-patch-repair endonuclease
MVRFRARPTRRARELRNNATDAEKQLWYHLRNRQLDGHKFSRQMPVGPFICDFMCRQARLVVELDGGQHDAAAGRDEERTRFIESEGYRVIRFWNNDVLGNMDGVLTEILRVLEVTPTPGPSRKREGNG